MSINVSVSAQGESNNLANGYSPLTVTFGYTGDDITPSDSKIYYAATLTDDASGTHHTENVLFSYTLASGGKIPLSQDILYTPGVPFSGTITPSNGKVYYVA